MRKAVFLLAPLVAAGLLFACEDDKGGASSGGNFQFEAGSFDAGQPPPPQDGATPDVQADADAQGPVIVSVVKSDGTPAASIPVVVHDATGAVAALLATAADGRVTIPDPPPPMVSVLLSNGRAKHVVTWVGVHAGDVLHARDLAPYNTGASSSYTVTFGLPPVAQEDYRANVGDCTGYLFTRTPAPIVVNTAGCVQPGNVNAILARGRTTNTDQYFAFSKGNAPPPPDGGTTQVALGAWAAFGTVALSATNRPANSGVTGSIQEIAGAQVFPSDMLGIEPVAPATFRVAPGFADALQVGAVASLGNVSFLTMAKRIAPAATASVDFAQALPAITNATLDRKEYKRPKVDWTVANGASLATTDGGAILLAWSKPNEDPRGWTLLVPPGTSSVKAPALPTTVDDWAPPDPDGGGFASQLDPSVLFVETSLLPNDAAFRSQAGLFLRLDSYYDRLRGAVLPTNGDTLRATEWRNNVAF